jgi:multimeric flavodoxin WrbA
MVKIIGIVGSPRKKGNTAFLVEKALESAESIGVETDIIYLGRSDIRPCKACNVCKETGKCSIKDDMNSLLEKVVSAHGIIVGSPVYFGNVTAQTKIFMDRSRPLRGNFQLQDKVGAAISVGASRNGGQETTCAAIHDFLLIHDAVIVGDGAPSAHYGATGVGGGESDCQKDLSGISTAESLGKRVANLALKLN